MKYMLDTNICIYLIKKAPFEVLKKFNLLKIGDACISSITYSELIYGVEKSQFPQKNKLALDEFTAPLEIIPFSDEASITYGKIRAYLEKQGMPIGSLDLLIAAHAQQLDLILVTNNIKEFSRVPKLASENWASPSPKIPMNHVK